MSHVNGIEPVGTPSTAPGATNIYRVLGDVPPDLILTASVEGSDGSVLTVDAAVDRASMVLVFGVNGPAPHEVRVFVNGGTVAAVPGQPDQFAWTLPT